MTGRDASRAILLRVTQRSISIAPNFCQNFWESCTPIGGDRASRLFQTNKQTNNKNHHQEPDSGEDTTEREGQSDEATKMTSPPQTIRPADGTTSQVAETKTGLDVNNELETLQRAIVLAEEKVDSGPLTQWYNQRGDTSFVVCDPQHGGRTNHGTPLYIATVLDSSNAVKLLLSLGADPNWNHPIHGDTCLLHASERGYVDCLRPLLDCCQLNGAMHQTVDRKIFLGQGMPQYQEGGLNPLHVAAMNGRVEAVQLLLDYDDQRQRQQWLKETDSFGRGIIRMVVDTLAMKKEKSPMRSSLHSILHLLGDQLGIDASKELNNIPDASVANAAERERQRSLRARCLQAQLQEKHHKRVQGLLAIERSYVSLHPDVYCSSNLLPQDALVTATMGASSVKEPLPGIFTFPLLQRGFCSRLWEELHHYEKVAISQPEKELPLHVRHDSNLGNLQDCGFASFLGALQALLQPLVDQYLPNVDGPFEVYHAFLTRNSPELEKNSTFKLHRDKSDLTFNICLHKSEDVIGSTVGFYAAIAEGGSNESLHVDQLHRTFTYEHNVGSVVFHNGSHFHKTDPIQRGTRGSLIVWARLSNNHHPNNNGPRPKVGDVVCLRENARVRDGVLAGGGIGVILHDDLVSKEPFRVGHVLPERDGHNHSYYHVNDLVVLDDAEDQT